MTNETTPENQPLADDNPQTAPQPATEAPAEPEESFGDLLAQFEKSHTHKTETGQKQLQGTVISVAADQVFVDIGFKIEGVLPRSVFENNADDVKPGDTVPVSVTGRNEEGYYTLSRFKVAQPRDWSALEQAFEQKIAVVGTVTGVVKGGLTVDVGVRAFMPASRSGAREAAEIEQAGRPADQLPHYQARCHRRGRRRRSPGGSGRTGTRRSRGPIRCHERR